MDEYTHRRGRRLTARFALSVAIISAAVSVASMGTFASWTTTTEADSGLMATGTVNAALNGAAAFSMDVLNLAPDDSIQRLATFSNTGSIDLSAATLSANGTLDFAELAPYLEVDIAACTVPWTPQGSRFTCGGVQNTSLGLTTLSALNASAATLSALQLASGASTPLRFTVRLDESAPQSTQGKSTRITYTVNGEARAGQDR